MDQLQENSGMVNFVNKTCCCLIAVGAVIVEQNTHLHCRMSTATKSIILHEQDLKKDHWEPREILLEETPLAIWQQKSTANSACFHIQEQYSMYDL